MKIIEFFSGCSRLTTAAEQKGFTGYTLDVVQLRNERKIDFLIDFLEWDYKKYDKNYFDVLFFGIPCTAYSKASGGKHFTKKFIPITYAAHKSIEILDRTFEIINYFENATFYIENPAGRLYTFLNLKRKSYLSDCFVYRIDMIIFNFPTKKQTDIFTNSSIPFITNPVHRVNGKYQKKNFDNLSLKNRQAYTAEFANFIIDNALKEKNSTCFCSKTPRAERL